MEGGLKIGELARRAGMTAKAIRFCERKGILPPATRASICPYIETLADHGRRRGQRASP